MNIEKAISLSDHESGLRFMYEKALETSKKLDPMIPFIEIGTRRGGSALLLLMAIKASGVQRPLFTVDPYGKMEYDQNGRRVKEYGEGFYWEAMKELADYCKENECMHSHFRMTSDMFMAIYSKLTMYFDGKILPQTFGFVFLDGDHDVNIVTREVEWFSPLIVSGGVLCIDDIEFSAKTESELYKTILAKGYKANGSNRFFYEL